MKNLLSYILLLFVAFPTLLEAQGQFSGDLQSNFNIHVRDEGIGASGNQVNDNLKSSSDTWLNMRYRLDNIEVGMRFDMFNNSLTFTGSNERNGIGLGFWYAKAQIKKLTITAGHFYDQLGSGTTFRAYEIRGVGIDNAMVGLRLEYQLLDNVRVKAFTGRQKDMSGFLNGDFSFLSVYRPAISGIGFDSNWNIKNKVYFTPGASFVNRVLDPEVSMPTIVNELNSYAFEDRFTPSFNMYSGSIYNTLSVGNWSFYTEVALKSRDAIRNLDNQLVNEKGDLYFGSLSYSQKGFGISLQAKKSHTFGIRTSPLETGNQGFINFIPPQTRQNSLRLLSRYNHNTQELEEMSYQVDVTYSPKRGVVFNINYSEVHDNYKANNQLFFREVYADFELKIRKKPWKMLIGLQAVDYNQFVYEGKGRLKQSTDAQGVVTIKTDDYVRTLTPFAEFTWKFDRKKSIRAEFQYMMTKRNIRLFGKEDIDSEKIQDFGDWIYGLVEFNVAPHWSFSVSDTYNFGKEQNYYSANAFYTLNTTRFEGGYVKQNEGIICTGGVCRYQPAFSGAQLGISTTF